MRPPHILLASSNCKKLLSNLAGLIDPTAATALQLEIHRNVIGLFRLGESHFQFAMTTPRSSWRQKISRLYYGAYNVRRAIQLEHDGGYNTDVSDHKKVDTFPPGFPNLHTYKVQLATLRDDRNLADYDHEASETDLVIPLQDAEALVTQLMNDSKTHLQSRGVNV